MYAHQYKPRLVFFFTQFSFCLQLILQTIYVLKMEILHFLSSKSAALKTRVASNRERPMTARVRYTVLEIVQNFWSCKRLGYLESFLLFLTPPGYNSLLLLSSFTIFLAHLPFSLAELRERKPCV